jgi:hypothetical protein
VTGAWVERALWFGAVAGIVATGALQRAPIDAGRTVAAVPVLPHLSARPTANSLREAVDVVVDRNVFRAEGAPSEEQSAPPAMPVIGVPPPPKPQLVLRGILGGPPWNALVEGVPGRDGVVVLRSGEHSAGLTVRTIRNDTVVVAGFDTTWTLTIRRPW